MNFPSTVVLNNVVKLGPMATLWDGDGPEAALQKARPLLARALPPSFQVHAWQPGPVVDEVRKLCGNPTIPWVMGIGVDGIAKQVALKQTSEDTAVNTFIKLANRASNGGATALMVNAEGGWKRPPTTDEGTRLRVLIKRALGEIAETFPNLRLWFTSYDHPSYHSAFPWKAWLGKDSPITESYWQVYAAGSTGVAVIPHRGALEARELSAISSYNIAVRKEWVRADVPDGTPGDDRDLDWRPYLQLHHVAMASTVSLAVRYPTSALWALNSRTDVYGRQAFLVLCELFHRGYWGIGAVEKFQRDNGIAPDGIVGPLTLGKLGVPLQV